VETSRRCCKWTLPETVGPYRVPAGGCLGLPSVSHPFGNKCTLKLRHAPYDPPHESPPGVIRVVLEHHPRWRLTLSLSKQPVARSPGHADPVRADPAVPPTTRSPWGGAAWLLPRKRIFHSRRPRTQVIWVAPLSEPGFARRGGVANACWERPVQVARTRLRRPPARGKPDLEMNLDPACRL
jgi:hypothetical protein